MTPAPKFTTENPPDPMDTLHEVEKHVRQEAEAFAMLHVVKPNAMMVGTLFVSAVCSAVARLTEQGRRDDADKVLKIDPDTRQQTIAGLPIIISARRDAMVTGVLVGNAEIFQLQN